MCQTSLSVATPDSIVDYVTNDTRKDIFSLERWTIKTLNVFATSLAIFHKASSKGSEILSTSLTLVALVEPLGMNKTLFLAVFAPYQNQSLWMGLSEDWSSLKRGAYDVKSSLPKE
jgi:hypothetical protein